jgi:Uma2 family endonuclease
MSPVGGSQGAGTINLSSLATVYVRQAGLGRCFGAETGFRLARNPDTVLAPDWAFITKERLPDPIPDGFIQMAPDLVLETRSPNDSRREIAEKIALWLKFGVRVVWDLDPKREVLAVHRPGKPEERLGTDAVLTEEALLPGFSVPVRDLF